MHSICTLLLIASLSAGQADKSAKKPLLESWQAGYFEGIKVGHVHTVSTQTGSGESTRIRSVQTMSLVIKRYGSVMPISVQQTTEEDKDGKVLALSLSQQVGESPKIVLSGQVEGSHFLLKIGKDETVRKIPFETSSIGQYAQETLFRTRKVKSGDKLTMTSFELLLAAPITVRSVVRDLEKVDQLELRKNKEGKSVIDRTPVSLLRVDATTDPIKIAGTETQLPSKAIWLDPKSLLPQRVQFEMPGLGILTFYTTTKEAALKEGIAPDRLPDLGLNINISIKQTIDAPYKTTEAVYRITSREKLNKVFAEDDRQKVENVKDRSLELTVKAMREPGTDEKATPPGKEYLDSNLYVDSDDTRIQSLARAITRSTTDPWKKTLLIEKWVHNNMKASTAVGFPSASQIAKDLEGDCRQHALLMVALCRAAGVPARTAIGLLYVREPGRSPFFGFHMWSEVWIKGRWVAMDAVIGQGSVGATHLKMSDHSWSKTATLAPLLPISQVLGKLQIEVVRSK
jgi:hypothetical protein